MAKKGVGFPIGTKVKLKTKQYGSEGTVGDIFEITDTRGDIARGVDARWCYRAKSVGTDGLSRHYYLYHGDLELYFQTRREHIIAVRKELRRLKKEEKEQRALLDYLEKYEDEADFLAHKIAAIMKKGGDVAAIRAILKEKPPTNLL